MHYILQHLYQYVKQCFIGCIFGPFDHQVLLDHIEQGKNCMLPEVPLVSHNDIILTEDLIQKYGMV